ncbi:MAG: polyphosphate kinase 2 [Campylobacteraceae bacterium]|jgi:polyphosphate kinase 2|nr:polyphosphate kinase 2 [Campylobacteraceae bacterium]
MKNDDDKNKLSYEEELTLLQIELTKLQKYVKEKGLKILIIFEGRDAAGKGGAIKRFTEHINPRGARVVALEKPSDKEKTQWYFQRYVAHLPSGGEMVFFDRSWYNRAGVEPVMGFCTPQENQEFLLEVPIFENLLIKSGIKLFKFYFSISKEEQKKRFKARAKNPLKQYKLSPVDEKSQELWDQYTIAEHSMFLTSDTKISPWCVVKSDDKKKARINSIKYLLKDIKYDGKIDEKHFEIDDKIIKSGAEIINALSNNMGI